jgi:hypothetical protein
MGVVAAAGPFLPIFLVRLGASGAEVGLLSAVPGITAVAIALPIGRLLQGRRNIVPWYSRARLIAQMVYAAMAAAAVLAPSGWTVALVLLIWAVSTIPNTLGQVAFPIVMDGAAGSGGRYDLLGRRWAMMGLVTAVTVAIAGQFLGLLPFPMNYELLLVAFSGAAFVSFWFCRQVRIPNQTPAAPGPGPSRLARSRSFATMVRAERSFVRFEVRAFVVTAGTGFVAPLIPLFYVHEAHAPDLWIGIFAAGQSAGALIGLGIARRTSRRHGGARVLLPALLLGALAPLTLSVLHELIVVAVLAVAVGATGAAISLALFDELMQRVPIGQGVTFSSVDQSAQNIALTAAPLIGGALAGGLGIRSALVVATAISLVGSALFALDRFQQRRDTTTTSPLVA